MSVLLAVTALLFAHAAGAADVAGTARLIRERRGHTATALGSGKILVAGGQNSSGALADVEIFDSATGTFTAAARLLTPRAEHTATRMADGRVFLIGGRGGEPLTSTEFYDATRNVFSSGPSLSSPRFGHTATLLPDGRIVVIGGNSEGTAEIFDPRAGSFSALPCHLTTPRSFHAAVRLANGSILIAGGISRDGATLKSAEILHPDTLECEPIATMFAARSHFVLRMLPDGKVQAIGGDAERTMELFNPAGYFSSLVHLARAVQFESAALRSAGRVAILGPSARTVLDEQAAAPGGRETVRLVQNLLDRTDYSITEIPEAGAAIAAGGVSSSGRYQQTAVLFEASAATVTTDQTDYVPGQTVTITGTGWLPGETVTLNIHRDTNDPPDTVLSAVADANGNITNSDYVVQDYDLGVTFLLTATGQTSGYTAQTSFTDGNLQQVNLVPLSVTVAQGDNAVYAANVDMGGNTTSCTVTLDVPTVLPSGASYTISLPNPTTATNVDFSRTLTISTTLSTPPGTYLFTIRATGSGCQGNNIATDTGTLIVKGACDGQSAGIVCRAATDVCDAAETCDGVSTLCPTDVLKPSGTVCRTGSGDVCDPDETCTGSSAACPSDTVATAGTVCNPGSGDQCDPDEVCSGTAGQACPTDTFKDSNFVCRTGSGDLCDPDEKCTGVANQACPSDTVATAGTVCNPGSGDQCDPDEVCSGTAGQACPTDIVAPAGTTCRAAAGVCDAEEQCTGAADAACPADAKRGSETTCRAAAPECDVAEVCDGVSNACPADAYAPAGTGCTDEGNACTLNQCDGTSTECTHPVIPNCGPEACAGTNTPPVVTGVTPSSSSPIPIAGSVQITATFTDASLLQTHTCTIAWDDGNIDTFPATTESNSGSTGTCVKGHTYGSAGVYTVSVTVADQCSAASNTLKYEFVVVYDPNGGFVTGGGWISQPSDGYPDLSGKANFGFVSKYKKGNNIPDGETEFQFKAGDINFHSSAYDPGSLVISGGKKATYRGDGTVNGESGYRFVLIAWDGNAPGGDGVDRFRIKITLGGTLIYDNRPGASEDVDLADPTALGGGSIVIHK